MFIIAHKGKSFNKLNKIIHMLIKNRLFWYVYYTIEACYDQDPSWLY